jgi:DNA-binding LytR/AlgR family response regulator
MRTVAICDDNETELEQAARTIRRFADEAGYEVRLDLLSDVEDCVRNSPHYDAVFMDIEFEEGPLGIDAAARINAAAPNCQIVYLTNYLHYSLDVYRTNHAWFVLKSQLEQRLPEVFEKLAFVDGVRRAAIAIKPVGGGGIVSVFCDDIRYLERQNRVTRVFMRDDVEFDVREKVSELLDKLPETWFGRCHNSYAVHFGRVRTLRASELVLDNGVRLPVSRSRSKQFRSKYLMWAESRNV